MNADGFQLLPATLPLLARVGGIVACAPPFAGAAVPRKVRAMLAVALTVGLSPAIELPPLPSTIGGLIRLAMSLLFVAAQWAGSLMAMQLGLNLGEAFDPTADSVGSPLGHAYWLLTVVIFLGLNGHHALVRGIRSSFQTLPMLRVIDGTVMLDTFVRLLGTATSLAVRLAVPVFVTMFIVDLAIGMVGRTVPQVGLMTAGVAVRSIVGLIVMVLGMALAATVLQGVSGGWFASLQSALAGR
jgi:flagellar biosynthetic protein FliR